MILRKNKGRPADLQDRRRFAILLFQTDGLSRLIADKEGKRHAAPTIALMPGETVPSSRVSTHNRNVP